jgi:hypothetical protein
LMSWQLWLAKDIVVETKLPWQSATTHILHQYIETSSISDRNVRKRAQNNIDENSEHHSPLCPSSTVHTDGIDA